MFSRTSLRSLCIAVALLGASASHSLSNVVGLLSNYSNPLEDAAVLENSIVSMIHTDSKHMTADMKETVEKAINTLNTEIMANIDKSYKRNQEEIKEVMAAFVPCSRNLKDKKSAIATFNEKFEKIYKDLKKCIDDLPDGLTTRDATDTECTKVQKDRCEKKKIDCDKVGAIEREYEKYPPECKEKKKSGYVGWIYWNKEALENLLGRHDDAMKTCSDSTGKCEEKTAECTTIHTMFLDRRKQCHNLQTALEINTCKRVAKELEARTSYPTCYNDALAAYKKLMVILRQASIERTDQWRALQRITCFLGVFTKDSDDKDAEISRCRMKVWTTDKYNLYLPPAPQMGSTPGVGHFACTPEYVAKYYEIASFKRWKVGERCEWCAAHKPTPPPTPVPTPVPTPFPTPPPTQKPTPPPTKYRGQGCWVRIYTKKKFKGKNKQYTFRKSQCSIKGKPCYHVSYVGGNYNDKMKSWKAGGGQCHICFYKHANFIDLLGEYSQKSMKKSGKKLKQMSSVMIIDTRFDKKCPQYKSGKKKKKKKKSLLRRIFRFR